ncbi:MAG: S8 family serine peptidase [Pseudobdellovibrionaceae bacterium]
MFCSLAIIACVSSSVPSSSRSPASLGEKNFYRERRQNTLLLKLRAGATTEEMAALKALYEEFDLRDEKKLLKGKFVRLRVHNSNYFDQEESLVEQIKRTGAVQFSEPDYVMPHAFIPNDPLYREQWYHKKIQSELAWNYTQGNSSVVVAVCDAGFDLSHPDLASQFILPGYNTVKNNTEVTNLHPHGTMTSGVIAALSNNNLGVAGMAWRIRLLPIQISDQADGASTYSDVAECIQYASDHGAKVVNLSYDYAYTSALVNDAALSLRNTGGLLVVAAGNGGSDISAWGASPNMMVVGATDSTDALASFSNYGTPVDLVAPGVDIYTTVPGNSYNSFSGTSFSTPIVSGTAALIYSLKSHFTPAEVENFILSTTQNLGRIDAGSAVRKAAAATTASIFLDNLAPGVSDSMHTLTGKWCTSNLLGSYGMASLVSCGSGWDTYRFTPSFPAKGNYNVSIHYLSSKKFSKRVPVIIRSATGSVTKHVNMQAGGGTWSSLGIYSFNAGSKDFVQLNASTGIANVDGMKFEPVP